MSSETATLIEQGALSISSIGGRYAIFHDDGTEGTDLTLGLIIEIQLGGQWIPGHVAYAEPSDVSGFYFCALEPGMVESGYYFVADTGEIAGLCTGMKVRRVR